MNALKKVSSKIYVIYLKISSCKLYFLIIKYYSEISLALFDFHDSMSATRINSNLFIGIKTYPKIYFVKIV